MSLYMRMCGLKDRVAKGIGLRLDISQQRCLVMEEVVIWGRVRI